MISLLFLTLKIIEYPTIYVYTPKFGQKLLKFQIYPVLYDNWLFLTPFFFPLKKKREEEKENKVAKLVLNCLFFRIDFKLT